MKTASWIKELMIFSFLLAGVVYYVSIKGGALVNIDLIISILILILFNTLLSVLRIRFQFPDINFDYEIKSGNIAAAKVVSSIINSTAVIITGGIIALAWVTQ